MAKAIHNEAGVKTAVKRLLDKHDWFWFMPPANGFGRTGIADILAIKAGVFVAIETKFGKNTPSAMQKAFINSIRAQEAFAFVVRETTIDVLAMWLDSFDKASSAVAARKDVDVKDGATMLDALRILLADA